MKYYSKENNWKPDKIGLKLLHKTFNKVRMTRLVVLMCCNCLQVAPGYWDTSTQGGYQAWSLRSTVFTAKHVNIQPRGNIKAKILILFFFFSFLRGGRGRYKIESIHYKKQIVMLYSTLHKSSNWYLCIGPSVVTGQQRSKRPSSYWLGAASRTSATVTKYMAHDTTEYTQLDNTNQTTLN